MKNCIACAEEIQDAAKLCRYCQTSQSDASFLGTERPSGHAVDRADVSESDKKATSGFLEFFRNPQSWLVSDSSSDSESTTAKADRIKPEKWSTDSVFSAQLTNRASVRLLLIVVAAIALLVMITSTLSGGSSSRQGQSEMYKAGYQTAENWGQRNSSQEGSFWQCNDLANSYLITYNLVATQEEMDEWIQGCLAYLRG